MQVESHDVPVGSGGLGIIGFICMYIYTHVHIQIYVYIYMYVYIEDLGFTGSLLTTTFSVHRKSQHGKSTYSSEHDPERKQCMQGSGFRDMGVGYRV